MNVSIELVDKVVQEVKDSYDDTLALPMYRHPLYVGFGLPEHPIGDHFPCLADVIKHKLEYIEECKVQGNWGGILWATERPFRLQAFIDMVQEGILERNTPEYSEALRDVWTDSEHPYVNDGEWRRLFRRAQREHFLDEAERLAFDKLPDTITCYRGTDTDEPKTKVGLSFTLDRKTAVWFAKRWRNLGKEGHPVVITATGPKSAVWGPINERGESEVLCLHPELMTVRRRKL